MISILSEQHDDNEWSASNEREMFALDELNIRLLRSIVKLTLLIQNWGRRFEVKDIYP